MELSVSACSRFRIDSLLSLCPPGALLSSGGSSGCSAPPSPRRDAVPRSHTGSSSFLIRDILSGRRSSSDPGQAEVEARADEDFHNKSVSVDRGHGGASDPAGARLRKPRKARTAFSDQQLSRLERSFQKQKYLSVQDRMELAAQLQLSDTQVKTWYQNRRTKWKRQSAAGLELLAEASRMFLPTHYLYPPAPPTLDLYLYRSHTQHHLVPPPLPHILTHTERLPH